MNQWRKGIAQWRIKDTIYLSVVFSWDLPQALKIAETSKHRVLVGGPAAKIAGVQTDELEYPALPFHNPLATFTTRGCPNACPFCAVPIMVEYYYNSAVFQKTLILTTYCVDSEVLNGH